MKGQTKTTGSRKKAATKTPAKKIEGATAIAPDMKLDALTAANRRNFVAKCEAWSLDPIKTLNGVVSGFNKAVSQ